MIGTGLIQAETVRWYQRRTFAIGGWKNAELDAVDPILKIHLSLTERFPPVVHTYPHYLLYGAPRYDFCYRLLVANRVEYSEMTCEDTIAEYLVSHMIIIYALYICSQAYESSDVMHSHLVPSDTPWSFILQSFLAPTSIDFPAINQENRCWDVLTYLLFFLFQGKEIYPISKQMFDRPWVTRAGL